MTKEKLAQTVAKSAIPEGPWTDLLTGKELPPGDPTAMSHAFEAALFGKGLHSVLSPFTKEVWDDLTKKIFPATNSDGQLLHPTQDGVINFWKWAKANGSKILSDANGRPKPLYNAMWGREDYDPLKPITWLSSNPQVAGSYVGDAKIYGPEMESMIMGVMPHAQMSKAYATFQNPLLVDAQGARYHAVPYHGSRMSTEQIVLEARADGYDGVIFKSVYDDVNGSGNVPSTVVASLKPGRVKSATGNNGLWEHETEWMRSVMSPLDKDLVKKVLEGAPGVGLGAQDNPTLKQALKGSEYTLKTLERLPDRTVYPKGMIDEQLNRGDVTGAEKEVLTSVLNATEGGVITAKDLVKGFQLATNGFKLKPVDTGEYADYGLEDIGRGQVPYDDFQGNKHTDPNGIDSNRTTIWQLPFTLTGKNHFNDPKYFAHTREFGEKGTSHVVEIQSDAAQNAKGLGEAERAQVESQLQEAQRRYEAALDNARVAPKDVKAARELLQTELRVQEAKTKLAGGQDATRLAPMIKHWYRRIIGEVLARASREGKATVRFATADTVAKVEGWPKKYNIAGLREQIKNVGKELSQLEKDPQPYNRVRRNILDTILKQSYNELKAAEAHVAAGIEYSPQHQSIYDRYNTEIASHLRRLGGHNYTDPQGHTWIEVPTEKFVDKRIDMFGTTMMYSSLSPFDPKVLKDALKLLKCIPGYQIGEEKTRVLTKEALSTFYPEGLSDKAEQAAAVLAKGMAVESHLKSIVLTNDKIQDAYWEGKPEGYQKQWLMDWEAGKTPKSPAEAKMLAQYKERMKMAYESDVANGVKEYTPIDNYVYHLFENGPAVDDFLTKKYGVAWGDPRFTKAREFRYIKEALDAGFRMKTTSPVNVVQAREFASLVAGIRVHLLEDLTKGGLAMRKVGDVKMPHGMIPRRSPSGQMYYLYPEVAQVVHNAFDSRSLWADPGIRGMSFRSWMYMKNRTVPVILSLSAFHPLHIGLGMDFASEMTRISQELASGVTSAKDTIPRLVKALTLVPGQAERSYKGFRMLRVMSGEEKNPTPEETQSLNYMLRGGFIPFNTSEFTTSAMKQLRGAIKRNAYVTAGWKLPWAMLEAIGYPIYQKWIPAIKTANYLEDVASAIKSDPDLLHDEARMNVRLNKIRKSAEDRFGQMSYNTLFWNRWARDIGQATTLSLGWKLGFMRQFAGQPFETAHALGKLAGGESLKGLISKGELNKTMFVGYYTMMAMGLGGMVTYLMTGSPPQTFQDYLLPRVGGNNPDGSPRRVNTMFYTREYASFYTHVKNEGLGQGLSEYAVNSAAPNFKMAHEFFTGLDYRNHEIYDPSAPEWKQLVQKTSNILGDLDPISVESYQRTGDKKGAILGALGFSPAPKYMTESPIEGKIKRMAGYYNQHITPFEKAQYSDEVVKLHAAAQKGDEAGYQQALETLSSKYHLTGEDLSRIQKTSHTDPMVNMFKHLTSQQQLRLIKTMTPEEKQKYVRAAHNETKKQLLQESGE